MQNVHTMQELNKEELIMMYINDMFTVCAIVATVNPTAATIKDVIESLNEYFPMQWVYLEGE